MGILCLHCNLDSGYKAFNTFARFHLSKIHGLTSKEYYDLYLKKDGEGYCKMCGAPTRYYSPSLAPGKRAYLTYCGKKCSAQDPEKISKLLETQGKKNWRDRNEKEKHLASISGIYCPECEKQFSTRQRLVNHLISTKPDHNYNKKKIKDLYDRRYKREGEGICNVCGGPSTFYGLVRGYIEHCSHKCAMADPATTEKAITTRIKNGSVICSSQKRAFRCYETLVRIDTKKYIPQLFKSWNGTDYYTGYNLIDGDGRIYRRTSVDHKISIFDGFSKKINPYDIAHIDNLCICSARTNSRKGFLSEKDFRKIEKERNLMNHLINTTDYKEID